MVVGPVYHVFSGPRNFDRREAGLFFHYERYDDDAVAVNLTVENPLVIDTPAKAKAIFDTVPFDSSREKFHPHWWTKAVRHAKSLGHDAIDFQPAAFEGDEGWEYAASTVGEPQIVVFEPSQVSVVEAMKPELELDDWINQWSIDKGSAVEVWGNEELRQRIRDIVDAGGDVVPILLDPEHSYFQGNEGELRAAADREVAKWAKKGYQELAFEDNMDQGELLVFKQPDWRTLKDPAKVMKAFPKRPTFRLLQDCYRVMVPGGVMRVVVPDCEKFAMAYLKGFYPFLTGNRFLTPHFKDLRDLFIGMGGGPKHETIAHRWFWDKWTMAWALTTAGFSWVQILDFKEGDEEMRDFDNPDTQPISCYLEALRG